MKSPQLPIPDPPPIAPSPLSELADAIVAWGERIAAAFEGVMDEPPPTAEELALWRARHFGIKLREVLVYVRGIAWEGAQLVGALSLAIIVLTVTYRIVTNSLPGVFPWACW